MQFRRSQPEADAVLVRLAARRRAALTLVECICHDKNILSIAQPHLLVSTRLSLSTTTPHPSIKMADVSTSSKVYTIDELQQHKSRDDCWVLISGKVYNVTQFLDEVS